MTLNMGSAKRLKLEKLKNLQEIVNPLIVKNS